MATLMPACLAMNVIIRAIALLVLLVLSRFSVDRYRPGSSTFAAPDPNSDRYRRER